MPRHLLPALAFSLLLLGCACGLAYAADGAPVKRVTLFEACDRDIDEELCDKVLLKDVRYFATPFLVSGNGVMLAFAEAWYTESDKKSVDIVARYIETEGEDWINKATEKNGINWKTQLVLQRREGVNHYALNNPVAVVKGDKIYLLALTNWRNDSSQNGNGWHFELSVGAITGEVGNKKIKWTPSESLHSKLTQEVEKMHLKVFPATHVSAFLTTKETIVFSVNATNKEGAKGNAILQLKDDEEQWKVSFVENPEECRHFSLFEWKERIISLFFGCLTDTNYVKEYDEMKEEWKDADDRLIHVLISEHKPSDLISVTIGNKTALIFTGKLTSYDDGTSEMSFWYTEGNRMKNSEWLIKTPYTDVTSRRLLYTNGEFFLMYQDMSEGLGAIVLTHLHDQMRDIKSKLNDWDANDTYISKSCSDTAPKGASPDTLCVTPMPTDGLVGFLSDRGDETRWIDEYDIRNAAVRGGTRVKNGYTFRGVNSGVSWEVRDFFFSRAYEFTKYGLTVVATMSIHETPENDDAPLLTVEGFGFQSCYGLWYKNNQWKVVSKNDKEEPATDLEVQKEYRVAIVVKNHAISVYVNGKSVGSPQLLSAPGDKPFALWSAHIGRHGCTKGSGIHMTVTNAFFYHRALNDTELEAASKTIATATSADSRKTPELVPGATNKAELVPESTNKTEAVPESTKKTEAVPESTNKTEAVPEPTNKTETVTEATNKTEPVTEARSVTKPVTEPTNREDAVTEATNKTEAVPESTNKTEAVPESTNKTEAAPEPTNKTETTPAPTSTTEMPRDPEDSSVCVRLSFTSLFLLGCFCLVIF